MWATALTQIEAGLDTLASLNPAFLDTEIKKQVLARLHKVAARGAAVTLGVVASAGDIAVERGDRSVAGWLASQLRVDDAAARAQTRLAIDLESSWTGVGAALAAGSVSVAQASVIVKALNELRKDPVVTREHLVKAQSLLLADAAKLPARGLRLAGGGFWRSSTRSCSRRPRPAGSRRRRRLRGVGSR